MAKIQGSYKLDRHVIDRIKKHAESQQRSFNNMLELFIGKGLTSYEKNLDNDNMVKWIHS